MAAHRYWRLYVEATGGGDSANGVYCSLMELYLRTSIGGAQAATGGTASASSEGFGWVASNAFNNSNTGNGWHTATAQLPTVHEWLKYDFGAGNEKDIVEFAICPRPSEPRQAPRDFKLQWSDDDSTWTTLFAVNGFCDWLGVTQSFSADRIYDDAGISSRFWRVRSLVVEAGAFCNIGELQMYAEGSSANQCSGGQAFASACAGYEAGAAKAFDGSTSVFWIGWDDTEWVGYKFASAKNITRIAIAPRPFWGSRTPTQFVLEYWDGSAFQTAATFSSIGWGNDAYVWFDVSNGFVGGPPDADSAPNEKISKVAGYAVIGGPTSNKAAVEKAIGYAVIGGPTVGVAEIEKAAGYAVIGGPTTSGIGIPKVIGYAVLLAAPAAPVRRPSVFVAT